MVDTRLAPLYHLAKEPDHKCGVFDEDGQCVIYVSCGPTPGCKNKCKVPCKRCLFWVGYGLDNDIDNHCKKHVDNLIKEVSNANRIQIQRS